MTTMNRRTMKGADRMTVKYWDKINSADSVDRPCTTSTDRCLSIALWLLHIYSRNNVWHCGAHSCCRHARTSGRSNLVGLIVSHRGLVQSLCPDPSKSSHMALFRFGSRSDFHFAHGPRSTEIQLILEDFHMAFSVNSILELSKMLRKKATASPFTDRGNWIRKSNSFLACAQLSALR